MSKKRTPKYQKKPAKQGTFTWKAKHNIYLKGGDDTDNVMFLEGKTYNMTVKGMYSYVTDSEVDNESFITREWLKENFEEVLTYKENTLEVS